MKYALFYKSNLIRTQASDVSKDKLTAKNKLSLKIFLRTS